MGACLPLCKKAEKGAGEQTAAVTRQLWTDVSSMIVSARRNLQAFCHFLSEYSVLYKYTEYLL